MKHRRGDPRPERRPETRDPSAAWSLAVAVAAFAVYLPLVPPVTGDKDSAEFTLVLAFNGVAHPTGYPLYTLLGHLWTRTLHGVGLSWAFATNAWSAAGGAVAVGLLHRLGCALIPAGAPLGARARGLLALLPPALLALNPIWTYETTLAEVYSWHVAWALGTTLVFARTATALAGPGAWTARRLHLRAAGWGLLCGLGGAHHATSLPIVVPFSAVLLVMLARRGLLRPTLAPVVLLAALLPLSSYAIILWRATHPAVVQWPYLSPGLDGLLFHVTGQQYRRHLGHFAPSPEQRQMLAGYVWPFLAPGLALLAAWVVGARARAERPVALGIVLAAAGAAGHAFVYGVVDPSSYFLAPMALGLAALVPGLARPLAAGGATRRLALAAAAALALVAAGLAAPWLRTGRDRVALYVGFEGHLRSMWRSIPLDSAFVFWANDMTYKLQSWQLLEGEKPGLQVHHPLLIRDGLPHARFMARYGVDPAGGDARAALRAVSVSSPDSIVDRAVAAVEHQVNRGSPLPVVHFDARRGTVRLLRKAGGSPAASGGAPEP